MSQIHHDPHCKEIYAIDENNYSGPQDDLGLPDHSFLQARQPAQLALFYGGMSNSIPRMFSVARQYKDFGAITIAGGSHVDALPQEALSSGIDIVVHGEGEETMAELLTVLADNGDVAINRYGLAAVAGISFLDENGDYVFTGARQPIENLNELADTDLTLVKYLKKRWSAIPTICSMPSHCPVPSSERGWRAKAAFCLFRWWAGINMTDCSFVTIRDRTGWMRLICITCPRC